MGPYVMAKDRGVGGGEISAFGIVVLLTVAGQETAWQVGTTVVGPTDRVNSICAGWLRLFAALLLVRLQGQRVRPILLADTELQERDRVEETR
jgi:hypothetical protein